MSRIREMAVLAACERVIRTWPIDARMAFRDAVMTDVTQFVAGEWDAFTAQICAEVFLDRWRRGLPWPPDPAELAVPPQVVAPIDRAAIDALARRICTLGIELARLSR